MRSFAKISMKSPNCKHELGNVSQMGFFNILMPCNNQSGEMYDLWVMGMQALLDRLMEQIICKIPQK